MAAETFVVTGASPDTDRLDQLVIDLYGLGFPNAARSGLTITIDRGDLDGTGAEDRFAELLRFVASAGAGLTYTVSS